jgi:predicted metallopeptidase
MDLEEKTSLSDFLDEVTLGKNESLNRIFNLALAQVFSQQFLNKINNEIRKRIKLKEIRNRNQDVLSYNRGNNIYINSIPFNQRGVKEKMQILLHEFMHLLQRKKKAFFFKNFKEVDTLTNNLLKIAESHLNKPLSVFLTGRNVNLGPGGKHEMLGYLMNDKIGWEAISPEGKKLFIEELRRSRLFNLSHPFWKKRLI